MIIREVEVKLESGLEARPLAVFVQLASEFQSSIQVMYKDRKANGKSIMGMISLSVAPGEVLKMQIEGPDEVKMADKLEKYLSGNN